jgi:hypothetical protein
MGDLSLFNILVSVLLLVVGFLLNRVFVELDKIDKSTAELREALPKEYVTKTEFLRHIDVETRALEKLGADVGKRFDKIDILLEAVRVKQER